MTTNRKLGKLPARRLRGVPAFESLTTLRLPLPPVSCDYTGNLKHLGAMSNTSTSDCTAAACGHSIEVWTSQASTEYVVSDTTILSFYSATSGYVPGQPSTDQGAVASEVLRYWLSNSIAGHGLAGLAAILPGNRSAMRDAIYWFGICYLGVDLPIAVQDADSWVLPDGQDPSGDWEPGSWGGHAIPACAYDADGVTVISWGKLFKIGWTFLDAYCDEAYGLLSSDWATATSSPPGFNFAALEADMNALRVSS